MPYVQLVVAAVIAAVLLSAALNKAATLRQFVDVFVELGMPRRSAPIAAAFVIGAEMIVAAALLVRPASPFTLLGLGALAVGFAGAGALAIRTEKTIQCGCFGAGRPSVLGYRQIVLLPLVFAL